MEVGRKGRVMAVPAVLVEVLMGTRLREFELAAKPVVEVPPETAAVTTLRLYCAPTFLLQSGSLQLAVIYAVPGATPVRVAGLSPRVPVATLTLATADEPQVMDGLMY